MTYQTDSDYIREHRFVSIPSKQLLEVGQELETTKMQLARAESEARFWRLFVAVSGLVASLTVLYFNLVKP